MNMRIVALAAVLVLPLGAAGSAGVQMNEAFRMEKVHLEHAASTAGGGTLLPGDYDVKIRSLAGWDVRASFFDKNGALVLEADGKISGPATSAHGAGGGGGAGKVRFQDLHFTPQSSHSFVKQGNAINFIINGQGTNHILIGLLLPAVQKGGIVAPIDSQGLKQRPNAGAQKVQPVGK
jgi:hypothetical protein